MSSKNITFLVILLLFIEISLTYNRLDGNKGRTIQIGKHAKNYKKLGRNKNKKSLSRQEYRNYNDKSPVEFDVASFIQSDNELSDEEEPAQRNKKRHHISNDYELSSLVDPNGDSNDQSMSYYRSMIGVNEPAMQIKHPLMQDLTNTESFNLNSENKKTEHSLGKKSAFKHLKIPFFTHDNAGKVEQKKSSKLKLFCFNCPKKNVTRPLKIRSDDDLLFPYKVKRSYQERMCPVCKKKFATLSRHSRQVKLRKATAKVLHNSRQFYEQLRQPENSIVKDYEDVRKYNLDRLLVGDRMPRETEQEKQIRELEEVQRKIDKVQVTIPTIGGQPNGK